MTLKDYLKTSILMFCRSKNKIFYILISIICTVLSIGILAFSFTVSNYLKSSFEKNIGFRTLMVSPKWESSDLGKAELLNIKHVDEVYESKYSSSTVDTDFKSDYLDGSVELLYGSIKSLPNIIMGRAFKENERDVVICPMNFYPDKSVNNYNMNKENMIDGKKLLEKTFVIKYHSYKWGQPQTPIDKTFEKTVKVVGLYDNENSMNLNSQCYMSSQDLIEIIDITLLRKEDNNGSSVIKNSGLKLIVDDLSNVNYVKERLKELQFGDSSVTTYIDVNLVKTIQLAGSITLTIIIFTIIILTSFYTKKKILNENKTIGILKACGYDRKIVKRLYSIEFILTNVFSFIIGLLIFLIILFILKETILSAFIYSGIKIDLNIFTLLSSIIIIIIFPAFVARYNINKNANLEIVNLFNDRKK